MNEKLIMAHLYLDEKLIEAQNNEEMREGFRYYRVTMENDLPFDSSHLIKAVKQKYENREIEFFTKGNPDLRVIGEFIRLK